MFDYSEMKKYIEKMGLKQKYIAQKSGICERNMSLILSGKRKCTVEEYTSICMCLNVSLDKFLNINNKNNQQAS